MSGPYDDIINLPHPTSQRHPRMPIHDRAAIFSPFAALSGHGAAIAETARLTEQRIELDEAEAPKGPEAEQLDLFTDYSIREQQEQGGEAAHVRERKLQEAMLGIKKRYGKNAILKGMNLEDGATAKERNQTIGGHQA